MRLKALIESLEVIKADNLSDFSVKGITDDSRKVQEGFLFAAVKGKKQDGNKFISEAIARGAKAIVTQCQVSPLTAGQASVPECFGTGKCQDSISVIKVKDTRKALADLAAEFYGYPSRKIKCIGVTGTNGKTTITYLLESIFKQAGFNCGVIGTINYRFNHKLIPASNTTPNPVYLESILADMAGARVNCCALEASSHALEQQRVAGINFKYAIFTNLTSDHLDYHKNRNYYFAAKAKLFKMLNKDGSAIINIDDNYGRKLLKRTKAKIITYAIDRRADIRAEEIKLNFDGAEFKVATKKGVFLVKTKLIGRHNIYNILAAVAVALSEGIGRKDIEKGIYNLDKVSGRLEGISGDFPFKVFVDYAHTEDALKNVLISLGKIKKNRVIVIFGCGGDRDRTKRPKMGRVASNLADFVVVTSDNPRTEAPDKIIKEIVSGIKKKNFIVIPDRYLAIEKALSMAKADDIVLIAGKGHEQYQVFKDKTVHFDDRQVAGKILDEKYGGISYKDSPDILFTLNQILEATGGKFIYGSVKMNARGVSSDSRTLKAGDLFIAIRGDNFDGHNFINDAIDKGARIIVVDNAFRLDINDRNLCLRDCKDIAFVRVEDTIKALGDIASFHRQRFHIPVIAVSGSCGKTTTKDMIAQILSVQFNVLKNEGTFNNFIGLPHTLLKLNKDTEIAVLEMGTSKAGEIKRLTEIARPNTGVLTNIGLSHLEFFGTLDRILEEKYQLIENLSAPYSAILNGDDNLLKKKIKNEKNKPVFTFGINNKSDFYASNVKIGEKSTAFTFNKKYKFIINVLGRHNIYNALAAAACGIIFGINPDKLKIPLSNFILPSTRINLREIKGYKVIDDTYNSNPLSLECAIETLKNFSTAGKKVLVMGDMLELGEKSILLHRDIGKKIIKSGIDALVTVGRLSYETAEFVKAHASGLKVYSCGCALEARGILINLLKRDDLVLVKGSRAMQMEKAIQDL